MAKQKETGIVTQLRGFDAAHYATTERYAKQIDKLFNTACNEFAQLGADVKSPGDAGFSFDKFPKAKKQAQKIAAGLANKLQVVITTGIKSEWLAACKKNDAFLNSIVHTSRLTKEELEQYQGRNLDALKTFQGRKVQGMNLSQRVWKYVGDFKDAMEMGLDVGIGTGRSAQELSRDLRSYLNEPEKLFRRVRDKDGTLHLSKAAKLYNPGQGVYRSSAKNAMRLTRTEINMAYRESDHLRWQSLDFVVGFRVCLSNNHTTKDSKGKTVPLSDMCDELWGDYPKTFKFTGWHPQCRCYVVPIMSDYDEYNKNRANRLKAIVRGEAYKALPSRRTVGDVPAKFRTYIESISERASGWKSMPYYIRDNFKGGTIEGGLNAQIPTKTMNTAEPCTDFDDQIAHIKRWAYSFGLDVSMLDALRTGGERTALQRAIEAVRQTAERRQEQWQLAWNAVRKYAETKAKGYKAAVSICEAALKANEIKTSNYYDSSIANLMTAKAQAAAMVAEEREKNAEKEAAMLQAVRVRRGEIMNEFKAKEKRNFMLPQFKAEIQVSNTAAKEWLNQPHAHIAEKNEMLLRIDKVLKNEAKYLGYAPDKKNASIKAHLYEVEVGGEKSWVIVREIAAGDIRLHSITDSKTLKEKIVK